MVSCAFIGIWLLFSAYRLASSTPSASATVSISPTALASATASASPTAAPSLWLWYLRDGTVYRQDMQSQAEAQSVKLPVEPIEVPNPAALTYDPVLSPDANYLALADEQGLHIVALATSEIVLTLPHDRREGIFDNTAYIPFQWSPDGKWLLVQLERYEVEGVGILNLGTGQLMEIEEAHQRSITCGFTGAVWDNDSTQTFLFFENTQVCDGVIFPGVYANRLTSPDLTALFTFSFDVQIQPYPVFKMDGSVGTPAFRPYSDSIVFSQMVDWKVPDFYREPVTRLYVMQTDGTDPHPITFNTTGYTYAPVWDSSGEQLVYSSVKVENTPDGIYRSQPDGTGAQLLVPGEAWAPLSISPDNAYLVFAETNSNQLNNDGGVRPLLSNGFQIFDFKKQTYYSISDASFIGWQMVAEQ
jgi:hypothetical protein